MVHLHRFTIFGFAEHIRSTGDNTHTELGGSNPASLSDESYPAQKFVSSYGDSDILESANCSDLSASLDDKCDSASSSNGLFDSRNTYSDSDCQKYRHNDNTLVEGPAIDNTNTRVDEQKGEEGSDPHPDGKFHGNLFSL